MATPPDIADVEVEERAQLTVFLSKEAYIYKIPPASTIGHRADTWNVDSWLQVESFLKVQKERDRHRLADTGIPSSTETRVAQEVSCAVVTCGNDCKIRLCAEGTGELFAECPVPKDQPLTTVHWPAPPLLHIPSELYDKYLCVWVYALFTQTYSWWSLAGQHFIWHSNSVKQCLARLAPGCLALRFRFKPP